MAITRRGFIQFVGAGGLAVAGRAFLPQAAQIVFGQSGEQGNQANNPNELSPRAFIPVVEKGLQMPDRSGAAASVKHLYNVHMGVTGAEFLEGQGLEVRVQNIFAFLAVGITPHGARPIQIDMIPYLAGETPDGNERIWYAAVYERLVNGQLIPELFDGPAAILAGLVPSSEPNRLNVLNFIGLTGQQADFTPGLNAIAINNTLSNYSFPATGNPGILRHVLVPTYQPATDTDVDPGDYTSVMLQRQRISQKLGVGRAPNGELDFDAIILDEDTGTTWGQYKLEMLQKYDNVHPALEP